MQEKFDSIRFAVFLLGASFDNAAFAATTGKSAFYGWVRQAQQEKKSRTTQGLEEYAIRGFNTLINKQRKEKADVSASTMLLRRNEGETSRKPFIFLLFFENFKRSFLNAPINAILTNVFLCIFAVSPYVSNPQSKYRHMPQIFLKIFLKSRIQTLSTKHQTLNRTSVQTLTSVVSFF